ncbi:MAG: DUF5671 domain-containing protein [Candidatus Pacebacteria bacterium]|jgi:hypothetical protein|nr:DUF5671 domain-containing protein [Candidatus Paceibacterota bacterium]
MAESKNEEGRLKSSPKDVFLHLLMIGTLYVSTFMFSSLWFDYVNLWFPDKLNYYYRSILDGILVGTSTLIVVFPVYLLTSWLLEKEIKAVPEKRELRVRKWLVYLTLFVAAIAIIVEIILLVYNFLSGELTMNFFLKIAVVFAVAAVTFGYYLWDARRTVGTESNIPKYLAYGTGLVVLGSVILSFFLVGSPAHQRSVRFDDQRVSDLQNIQYQIISYWQQKDVLPAKLSDMTDNVSGFIPPTDPDTRAEYEYTVKSPLVFELCATFGAKSVDTGAPDRAYPVSVPEMVKSGKPAAVENWSHSPGRTCFERTIDPEIYKTNEPLPVIIQNKEAIPAQ